MKTTTGMAIFAPMGSPLWEWAQSAVESGGVLITDPEAIVQLPRGTAWMCSADQSARVRSLRPADPVLVVRDVEVKDSVPPWGQLAHDLRGPISVLAALGEFGSSDPMLELAERATRQLTHLARCWEACGGTPKRTPTSVLALLERTQSTFAQLEPRRAELIRIRGPETMVATDAHRLELGLVCLWSHLSRVHREPIVVRPHLDGIEMEGLPSRAIRSDPPHSSRLDLALRLLTPLTDRWEVEVAVTRWVAGAV